MPLERSRVALVTRQTTVDYFGEKFSIVYKPGEMTPQKEQELADLRAAAEASVEEDESGDADIYATAKQAERLAERIAVILVDWDIVEDGAKLPPTKENLMTFPNALLTHISLAIAEDMSPKMKTRRR